jgi:hypothetical protein
MPPPPAAPTTLALRLSPSIGGGGNSSSGAHAARGVRGSSYSSLHERISGNSLSSSLIRRRGPHTLLLSASKKGALLEMA